jgi:hypothetical protein
MMPKPWDAAMTITREMIRTAEEALSAGHCDSSGLERFTLSRQHSDGGFFGRGRSSELYFTQFALMICRALKLTGPVVTAGPYIESFGEGADLSLVDLCSLARCHSLANRDVNDNLRRVLVDRIDSFRARDGGFAAAPGQDRGTMYGCFMALGAFQDLGAAISLEGIATCVQSLRNAQGGYVNDPAVAVATTPTTAAAMVILNHLGLEIPERVGYWLKSRTGDKDGFSAAAFSPAPDLLSTAVALLALYRSGVSFDRNKAEACREFVLSLQRENGGFSGAVDDPASDVEYSLYGLLALGSINFYGQ